MEEGRKMLVGILYEEPGYAKAHAYLGWYAHNHTKDRKLARLHYEFALKFDPNLGYTYINFAELLIEEVDEKAMRNMLALGKKHPDVDKAMLYNDMGRLLEIKEEYVDAAAYYRAGMKYTMNYFTMQNMMSNRKRVTSKYR